jgi:membrane associated rhomboid family serine protease
MAGSPDLFVVCKNCRAEVSPYITECPYCGHRLRKRAPKLDKGAVPKTPKRRRRPQAPSLGRLKPGEIPGIRAEGRPLATILIVLVSVFATLAFLVSDDAVRALVYIEGLDDDWWKLVTTNFVYPATDFGGTSYELLTLSSIFLFGWLLERRHGPWVVLVVFLVGATAGMAVSAALPGTTAAVGGNGGALALLCAWVVRDLLALRRGEEVEADLLGVVAFVVVLALLPAAVEAADPIVGIVGALVGLLIGLPLARMRQR